MVESQGTDKQRCIGGGTMTIKASLTMKGSRVVKRARAYKNEYVDEWDSLTRFIIHKVILAAPGKTKETPRL